MQAGMADANGKPFVDVPVPSRLAVIGQVGFGFPPP